MIALANQKVTPKRSKGVVMMRPIYAVSLARGSDAVPSAKTWFGSGIGNDSASNKLSCQDPEKSTIKHPQGMKLSESLMKR